MTVKFPAIANLFKRDQAVNQLELPLPPSLIPAVKKNINQDAADTLVKKYSSRDESSAALNDVSNTFKSAQGLTVFAASIDANAKQQTAHQRSKTEPEAPAPMTENASKGGRRPINPSSLFFMDKSNAENAPPPPSSRGLSRSASAHLHRRPQSELNDAYHQLNAEHQHLQHTHVKTLEQLADLQQQLTRYHQSALTSEDRNHKEIADLNVRLSRQALEINSLLEQTEVMRAENRRLVQSEIMLNRRLHDMRTYHESNRVTDDLQKNLLSNLEHARESLEVDLAESAGEERRDESVVWADESAKSVHAGISHIVRMLSGMTNGGGSVESLDKVHRTPQLLNELSRVCSDVMDRFQELRRLHLESKRQYYGAVNEGIEARQQAAKTMEEMAQKHAADMDRWMRDKHALEQQAERFVVQQQEVEDRYETKLADLAASIREKDQVIDTMKQVNEKLRAQLRQVTEEGEMETQEQNRRLHQLKQKLLTQSMARGRDKSPGRADMDVDGDVAMTPSARSPELIPQIEMLEAYIAKLEQAIEMWKDENASLKQQLAQRPSSALSQGMSPATMRARSPMTREATVTSPPPLHFTPSEPLFVVQPATPRRPTLASTAIDAPGSPVMRDSNFNSKVDTMTATELEAMTCELENEILRYVTVDGQPAGRLLLDLVQDMQQRQIDLAGLRTLVQTLLAQHRQLKSDKKALQEALEDLERKMDGRQQHHDEKLSAANRQHESIQQERDSLLAILREYEDQFGRVLSISLAPLSGHYVSQTDLTAVGLVCPEALPRGCAHPLPFTYHLDHVHALCTSTQHALDHARQQNETQTLRFHDAQVKNDGLRMDVEKLDIALAELEKRRDEEVAEKQKLQHVVHEATLQIESLERDKKAMESKMQRIALGYQKIMF